MIIDCVVLITTNFKDFKMYVVIRYKLKAEEVKLIRAHGECLGTRSRRRTVLTPICFGEL